MLIREITSGEEGGGRNSSVGGVGNGEAASKLKIPRRRQNPSDAVNGFLYREKSRNQRWVAYGTSWGENLKPCVKLPDVRVTCRKPRICSLRKIPLSWTIIFKLKPMSVGLIEIHN